MAGFAIAIAVGSNVPARSIAEFAAWAKDAPGGASYGVSAAGGLPHLFAELVGRELIPLERITVATPGADRSEVGAGTRDGRALLCVGVIAAHKGQDILIEALAGLRARPTWRCTIVGSSATDPAFAERLAARAADLGIADRITMTGVLDEGDLDAAYRGADLLVAVIFAFGRQHQFIIIVIQPLNDRNTAARERG